MKRMGTVSSHFALGLLLVGALCAPTIASADQNTQNPDGPLSLIGLQLYQVISRFGAPSEVYPIRGEQAWQDDVVFYYSSHVYFYWYENRVWQVRFDKYFEGSFLGLSMGASISSVEKSLGNPIDSKDNWAIFQLPDQGYPVRARLFFSDGSLTDAYIYRSDF